MMNRPFTRLKSLLAICFFVAVTACSKKDLQLLSTNVNEQSHNEKESSLLAGNYTNGILLVNEGWFGHENGSVNFYAYGEDTIQPKVYHKENPGKDLGVTTQHGAIWNGKLYLVSKQGPLVVTNAATLVETGRIADLPDDGRAFAGIDASLGLISTQNGIYRLNLSTLALGAKISGITGQTGSMLVNGNYVYVLSESSGVIILNKSTLTITKTIAGPTQGFAKTSDGSIWASGGTKLVKIHPTTLDTNVVTLPFAVGNTWGAWNDGTMTAASNGNAVYIAKTQSWGAGGNQVYRYVQGNPSSLNSVFITLPANKEFYGSGVRFNAGRNELTVTAVQSGFGQNYKFNSLYIYDTSGTLIKTVNYTNFYFPALMIFV